MITGDHATFTHRIPLLEALGIHPIVIDHHITPNE
jgi:single-stranded DNA-specific DHH superfamily exonuclease